MQKVREQLNETHFLYQYPDGFSFGTDAVLLAGFIRPRRGHVGVEFGTGTGIIPLLLAMHKSFSHITALEIQADYAALARENVEANGFSDRITVLQGDLKQAKALIGGPVDFVFTNPPYMKRDSGKGNESERKRIARHEILCDLDDICRSAASLLQDKGEFYAVYRTERLAEMIFSLKSVGLEPKTLVMVTPKPSSQPELFLLRAVKGARPGLRTRPPFIIQDENGEKSDECRLLYETGVLSHGEGV